jgi:hypothetical protein
MDFLTLEQLRAAGGSIINPIIPPCVAVAQSPWTDFWAATTAVATTLLFLVGWLQIRAARNQTKGWQTMAICERYESDPVLHECLLGIAAGRRSGDFLTDSKKYRIEVTTILNYLDGIAIGIEQNLYVEDIARDHLEAIANHYVKEYLTPQFAASVGFDLADYDRLRAMSARWCERKTRFNSGWRFFRH